MADVKKLNLLIIGGGGREHVLVWKLKQSPRAGTLYVAPGNGGTETLAVNVPVDDNDAEALCQFARKNQIDLTIVGPEMPLAAGITDIFHAAGLRVFGPSRLAAQLESSKVFAKGFMADHNIPTAAYAAFSRYDAACAYVAQQRGGMVVKASGLAAGKGVILCDDVAAAEAALYDIMVLRRFGNAGDQVIIEERLNGPEVSLLAFTDGQTVVPMLPARDYKRAYDHNQGPNTGGMGAYTPLADVDAGMVAHIVHTVLQPVVLGMAERQMPYVGVLYAGMILTAAGPKVLEFNCRFGDPETQVILPMLDGDLLEIMLACLDGTLDPAMVQSLPGACVAVVMAAPGYPGAYPKGLPIRGVAEAEREADVMVFHAGTTRVNDRLETSGGRVLAVTALGDTVAAAAQRAYAGISHIHFDKAHYRRDIGLDGTA
ncbi:MAG: phosphoribosylamine--glycine ligase [Candidatus Promineifilaceae bacterium]